MRNTWVDTVVATFGRRGTRDTAVAGKEDEYPTTMAWDNGSLLITQGSRPNEVTVKLSPRALEFIYQLVRVRK